MTAVRQPYRFQLRSGEKYGITWESANWGMRVIKRLPTYY